VAGADGTIRSTVDKVLALYRDQYFDFNVKHFHQKLRFEHGIQLSYTWVKQTLQAAGLVKKRLNGGVIAAADHDGRYRACCYTWMAVIISGSRMIDGMT